MKTVTVIGAGNVGATVAQRLALSNVANVVMLDINEGVAKGKALDLNQAVAISGGAAKVKGTSNYADTAKSDVVVITAGSPRKPGMSRDDLLRVNASIVTQAAAESHKYSPRARFVVVSNPLDVMTYLTWQVTGVSSRRIVGMAGLLDSARFQMFIAEELKVSPEDVRAMVLGGHGDLMVPLPRFSTVNGVPLPELLSAARIQQLCDRTRNGGAEIVELLKSGSAWYAPGVATADMVTAILKDSKRLIPACVHTGGKHGLPPIFIGLPAVLGARGIERVVDLKLNDSELEALRRSAQSVHANVALLNTMAASASAPVQA